MSYRPPRPEERTGWHGRWTGSRRIGRGVSRFHYLAQGGWGLPRLWRRRTRRVQWSLSLPSSVSAAAFSHARGPASRRSHVHASSRANAQRKRKTEGVWCSILETREFPCESESWSGAKSGAKLRKSARYPGIFQVYRGFPGIPAKYPVFCRFWPQNSLRHGSEPPQNDEFHGVSPGFPEETRGCCRETSRKHGKE